MSRVRRPGITTLSPDGRRLAYTLGDTLWIQPEGGRPRAVLGGMSREEAMAIPWAAWTADGTRLAVRAGEAGPAGGADTGVPVLVQVDGAFTVTPLLADSLARRISTFRSFLTGAPAWSPDGTKLAFVGWEPGGPDAAATSVYVTDVESGALRRIDTGAQEPYNITWSPDGRWLVYTRGAFRGTDGAVVVLAADDPRREHAVYTGGAGLYRAPLWSPDGRTLMVRDLEGSPVMLELSEAGQLTDRPVALPRRRYAGFTADGRHLIATVADGMASVLTMVDVRTGKEEVLRATGEVHDAIGVAHHPEGDRVVFSSESGDRPPEIWSAPLTADGALGTPERLTALHTWLDRDRLARATVFRWESASGAPLEAQLFLPRRSYAGPMPLVVMPYGGYRDEFPGADYFFNLGIHPLATRGYAVVRPNTRGYASEQRADGWYGEVQLADTRALVAALAREGLVDSTRVVLLGHSHGGAMVYYYLTHSDFFAGGIAVNGAADWFFQAGLARMAGLPGAMGGTPDEVPDRYERLSPLAQFRRLTVPLLAVTGGLDTQIPESQSAAIVDSLRALGRDALWRTFPTEGHLLTAQPNIHTFWEEALTFIERVTGPADS